MRLGFWNRLGVVGLGLALLVAPIALVYKQNADAYFVAEAWRDICLVQWEGKELEPGYISATSECRDEFIESAHAMTAGWDDYGNSLLGTAVIYAILYALVWGIVWVVKWVWRGREARKEGPAEAT